MDFKSLRKWLSSIFTVLLIGFLFVFIFIAFNWTDPTPEFYVELGVVVILTLVVKSFWYNQIEDNVLQSPEIREKIDVYSNYADRTVSDIKHFEDYLKLLDVKNQDDYMASKMANRTPVNLQKLWFDKLIDRFKKPTEEDIIKRGQARYDKLYKRYSRKASRIRPLNSMEILTRTNVNHSVDSRNRAKSKKISYQTLTTIHSIVLTIVVAGLAFSKWLWSADNIAHFVAYVFTIVSTVITTIYAARRNTTRETSDHLARLQYILDGYAQYKRRIEDGSWNGFRLRYVTEAKDEKPTGSERVGEPIPQSIEGTNRDSSNECKETNSLGHITSICELPENATTNNG